MPPGLVDRVRHRLFEMRDVDVVEVVEALAAAGVRTWIAGGWGVDALVGRQSRRHKDLDLVVDAGDESEARAREVLDELGYATVGERVAAGAWMPLKVVLRHPGGRTIDLLPVRLDGQPAGANAEVLPGGLLPTAFARGVVAGRSVGCLSPSVQLTFHTGYALSRVDRQDIALLCSRFGLAPPETCP